MFKGLKHLHISLSATQSFAIAICFGIFTSVIGWFFIRNIKEDIEADKDFHFASVEKVFTPMMLFTACSMAFAHGSNDVANGIGPLAAVISIVNSGGEVMQKSEMPTWILFVGGGGIVLGLITLPHEPVCLFQQHTSWLVPCWALDWPEALAPWISGLFLIS